MLVQSTVSQWGRTATGLVFPARCPGCGQWNEVLCFSCVKPPEAPLITTLDDVFGLPILPIYSLGRYGGRWRRVIVSAKHDPVRDFTVPLRRWGQALARVCCESLSDVADSGLVVIPAPSSHMRRWKRHEVTVAVSRGVAFGLGEYLECPVWVAPLIRLRPGVRSQSGKNTHERQRGRVGAMMKSADVPAGLPVIVVDDVLTTGGTLREMVRLVGGNVVAATVLAAVVPG